MRTYWNAHALRPDVTEAQDALAVRDDHDPDVVARPVRNKLRYGTLYIAADAVNVSRRQGQFGALICGDGRRALSWVLT